MENEIEQMKTIVRQHAARYPAMQPQDYGKLAYQSEFGPAHLTQDADGIAAALMREWASLPSGAPSRAPEPIGSGLSRLHLDPQAEVSLAAPVLAALVRRTAQTYHGTADGLRRRIALLRTLDIPGMDPWLDGWETQGCPPVHHSDAFCAAYQPHYRVIRTDLAGFFPVLLEAARLIQAGKPAVLAIDGRCGSGKSSLAALLHDVFGCNILHMDDFYLPLAQRAADWAGQPAGNMDLERFRAETLIPALAGQPVPYRAYSCQHKQYQETITLPPTRLTVVEGSYSHHPSLAPYCQRRVFLTCSKEAQARRLQAREGAHYAAFTTRWIPMEELYYRACGVPAADALVLDTSDLF